MQNRISEMENQEVDYLRFDRIKIQRKRMEHILEVIKDLSFKNKQLFKENAALKQERLHDSHYQKLYRQITAERAVLVDKNIQLTSELEKYRETALHQEILINSLKKELYGESISIYRSNFGEVRHEQAHNRAEKQIFAEEYSILEAQYEDLKKEYSKLYKLYTSNHQKSRKKRSVDQSAERTLCDRQNEKSKILQTQFKNQQNSHPKLIVYQKGNFFNEQNQQLVLKLKEKYQKCKKAKKQLSNQIKILHESLNGYEVRQRRHVELIEILKEKKTKICMCHVNKLKKKMSQTMLQGGNLSPQHALYT